MLRPGDDGGGVPRTTWRPDGCVGGADWEYRAVAWLSKRSTSSRRQSGRFLAPNFAFYVRVIRDQGDSRFEPHPSDCSPLVRSNLEAPPGFEPGVEVLQFSQRHVPRPVRERIHRCPKDSADWGAGRVAPSRAEKGRLERGGYGRSYGDGTAITVAIAKSAELPPPRCGAARIWCRSARSGSSTRSSASTPSAATSSRPSPSPRSRVRSSGTCAIAPRRSGCRERSRRRARGSPRRGRG